MDSSPSLFEIAPNSGIPIYRQLIDQVHALLAGGQLRPGDRLPSVREVARAASINPMTVSKAYARLEAEGVVQRVRGQGMEVRAASPNGTLAQRKQQFVTLVRPALHRASQLGLSNDEVLDLVRSLLEEQST